MAFANGLKLAALCVLVLTMGQMMAVLAGTEYFPAATVTIDDKRRRSEATLINLDPAPSWLETHAVTDASAPLLQFAEQERSTSEVTKPSKDCLCSPATWWCCPPASGVAKPSKDCLCSPATWWCCPPASGVAKPSEDCLCSPATWWCCPPASGVAKPSEFCICTPEKWWCCPPISGVAKPSEDCLCSPATWFCCPEASGVAKPSED
ncbi:uncharacterized protein [Aegilops tauschii subsp. strangulata]|uniref:uncharacterized protein n=1 Tax=Aegilops tauschii subsp. strangulata TaxID=200361 RepID=UPI003CC86C86